MSHKGLFSQIALDDKYAIVNNKDQQRSFFHVLWLFICPIISYCGLNGFNKNQMGP